ncbi:MAG: STAS domain-containing protein [Chloroflexota bacterium]
MTANQFDLSVRHQEGVAILDLRGEINAFAERALAAGYDEAEAANPDVVLLNFEDVAYINSTGIALIVTLLARARAGRRRLLACGLSDHYVEIFNITRLADFMTVFPDESSALSEAPERAVMSGGTE